MRVCTYLCLFLSLASCLHAARILGVFHPAAPSHFFCGNALMKALAQRGHQVTLISSFGQKKEVKNLKDVVLTGFTDKTEEMQKDFLKFHEKNFIQMLLHIFNFASEMAANTLNHTNVQTLLKSNEEFDLIIMEAFLNEVHLGLSHRYKAPVVVLSTVGANPWVNQYTGNPSPTSYVGELLSDATGKMTFLQRTVNFLMSSSMSAYNNLVYIPAQNEILHKFFPDAPHLTDLFKNVAMVLLNSHASVSPAKPLVPNMVEVGGFHVDDPKELPKDLKDYLDACKQGFILFSMGSNFRSSNFQEATRKKFLNVFSKLPYKILWKFEKDLPEKPSNVRIEKWLPQNDILAHPNLKVFITHGGLLSTTEAVYHGVPLVGIPVFGDQKMNMARAVGLGIGKMIDLQNFEEAELMTAIKEVIENPSYRKTVRQRSNLMRDQPMKPIEHAVFWVEHVLRNKGAEHFKTGALELKWYELYQVDVIAFILGVLFAIIYTPYKLIKCILCKKDGKKYKAEKEKKKKN